MEKHTQVQIKEHAVSSSDRPYPHDLPNIKRIDADFLVKDYYEMNDTEFRNIRGQKFATTSVSGSVYSMAATEYLIGITSLALAPTIGLPRPQLVGKGKTFIVKDEAGGAATTTITIQSVGEESIDGASSATIITNYGSRTFYTNGANWFTC